MSSDSAILLASGAPVFPTCTLPSEYSREAVEDKVTLLNLKSAVDQFTLLCLPLVTLFCFPATPNPNIPPGDAKLSVSSRADVTEAETSPLH